MRRVLPLVLWLSVTAVHAADVRFPRPDARWSRIRSEHFEVVTSAGERNASWTAQRLETLYSAMTRLRGEPARTQWQTPRLQFFTFGRRADLQPYLDTLFATTNVAATGAYFSLRGGGVAFVDASGPSETAEHELIHAALASPGRPLPLWLEEGLAEFFSHYRSGANQLTFGAFIRQRGGTLRAEPSMPVAELLTKEAGDPSVFGNRRRQAVFYAQSWAAVHTLMSRRDPLPLMTRFVARVLDGTPSEDALREIYALTTEELARSIERYGSVVPPRPISLTLPVIRPAEPAIREPLSDSDALTLLGKAMQSARPFDNVVPRAHFDEALRLEPEHPRALAALAVLLWGEQRAQSEALFERATKAAPADADILIERGELLLARALGPIAAIEPSDVKRNEARAARALFARARELAPRDARAAGGWAATFAAESGDYSTAIALLEDVRPALPTRIDLAAAELVMLYNSDAARAETLFAELDRSVDPQFRLAARAIKTDARVTTANRQAREGRHAEAAEIVRALAAESEGEAKTQLEEQAAELEKVAEANRQIELYNRAVAAFNEQRYEESANILDRLIRDGTDAETIAAARALREKAKRRPR